MDQPHRASRAAFSATSWGQIEQIFDRLRDPAVTIFCFGANRGERFLIARRRDSFVSPQPLAHVTDIALGNGNVHAEVERNRRLVFNLFAA